MRIEEEYLHFEKRKANFAEMRRGDSVSEYPIRNFTVGCRAIPILIREAKLHRFSSLDLMGLIFLPASRTKCYSRHGCTGSTGYNSNGDTFIFKFPRRADRGSHDLIRGIRAQGMRHTNLR
jgi:hypothetical protein